MVGTLMGSYRIVTLLGEGGMGQVWEAVHASIERRVALKVMAPHAAAPQHWVSRLFTEACAVNRVAHPGVVQVTDFGQTEDGTVFLVMELLRGRTLRHFLAERGGALPAAEVLWIGRQLAGALAAAHAAGVIHRDLKPENIMLVEDPDLPTRMRVKVLDFGIARLRWGHGPRPPHAPTAWRTGTGLVIGTPRYMAPEQAQPHGDLTDRVDVYALGLICFELLSGRLPAPGHPIRCPRAPRALSAILSRMLHPEPTVRPSMAEVSDALASRAASAHRASRPSWFAAGLGALSGSLLTALGLLPSMRAPAAAAPTSAEVRWRISSHPEGADVVRLRDSLLLGATPWERRQPAGSGEERVMIRHRGYLDQVLVLDRSSTLIQHVVLHPGGEGHAGRP